LLLAEVSGINGLWKDLGWNTSMKHSEERMLLKDFSGLKREQRDSGTDFLSIVLLLQFRAGWRVLLHSITTGVYLDIFLKMADILIWLEGNKVIISL